MDNQQYPFTSKDYSVTHAIYSQSFHQQNLFRRIAFHQSSLYGKCRITDRGGHNRQQYLL